MLSVYHRVAGQFPKPYPNGWYRVCGSSELKKGQVLAITCCGREMVAFRGADSRVGVLHAFCPHLGTHLGHGGTVQGSHLVCPYHSWEFDADGKNHCIPYCGKDMTGSTRVNARKYEVRERLDIVFVWYHAGGKGPEYEMTILDEVDEKKGEFRHIISEHVSCILISCDLAMPPTWLHTSRTPLTPLVHLSHLSYTSRRWATGVYT
jgi:phenylpropionate dioxygenase-like ring-hydroxylating dioxygenase large terminal subunit